MIVKSVIFAILGCLFLFAALFLVASVLQEDIDMFSFCEEKGFDYYKSLEYERGWFGCCNEVYEDHKYKDSVCESFNKEVLE